MDDQTWRNYYQRKSGAFESRARDMYKMYQQGMTYKKIGQHYGITADAVSKAVIRWVLRAR